MGRLAVLASAVLAACAGPASSSTRPGAAPNAEGVDPAKLASFVKTRMGAVKGCYESALKLDAELAGKIVIRFTILDSGELANVWALKDHIGSAELSGCIVDVIARWRTPFHPSEPVTVEYPFIFAPVKHDSCAAEAPVPR
jgi:hypothetical protein